jgi:hypothetical protein
MNYPLGNCFFEDFANEYAQMIQQIRLELPERDATAHMIPQRNPPNACVQQRFV